MSDRTMRRPPAGRPLYRRSRIERFFWSYMIMALVVGLIPGFGLFLYERAAMGTANTKLQTQVTAAQAESDSLKARAASTDATITALGSQVASLTAALDQANAQIAANKASGATGAGLTFANRTVSISSISASSTSPYSISVDVTGDATKVTALVKSTGGSYSNTFTLTKGPDTGTGTITWKATGITHPSTKTTYHVSIVGYKGTAKTSMSGYTSFTVK
jgi:uncharacterized membrane-anchored protein YhcB (DUF1043 family)